MKILVTGSAGFIGAALTERLLERGDSVIGVDNHNSYYDPDLKAARVKRLSNHSNYKHLKLDIAQRDPLKLVFEENRPQRVVSLAAQAGVRYSIENPAAYIDSNIVGFANVLEGCRTYEVDHLVYASTSSVYGANTQLPFSVGQNVDHPLSLYAATKKSNELMAHAYSHLYNLPTTGLRFFTVYGPWGRPDMALFKFTKAILEGSPIKIFNHGRHHRDFTYIDDIVEGIVRVLDRPPNGDANWDGTHPNPSTSTAPYRIFNIGNSTPVALLDYITALELALDKTAIKEWLPIQPGDIPNTQADVADFMAEFEFRPQTNVVEGIRKFVEWYKHYYR